MAEKLLQSQPERLKYQYSELQTTSIASSTAG
jgi:hypothetical protein